METPEPHFIFFVTNKFGRLLVTEFALILVYRILFFSNRSHAQSVSACVKARPSNGGSALATTHRTK
jgi:hypothetical protein